ncbi:unnamed protein product [Phytophthora lilii]|uniref:Unnamed protein product n=1 Tax=Phytophthora lilii TaxID=2077276 RepID=A0A9W6UEP9_9STRA|nr:unnamed protein product [Phytophthora lilii]
MNGMGKPMPTTKPFYHNCFSTTRLKSPVPPSKSHYHTFQQVMSPTQASVTDDRDFPRLNGRNFVIWKTRVTAALEGKNLLAGFVTQVDYAGDFDFDFSDDKELNPALSDMRDMEAALDAAGAPKADDAEDPSSSQSSSDASSETATAADDGDVDMGQGSPPVIQSFSATKQEEKKRAEKLRAKSLKQSSKRLCRSEAKAKAFLIKTIDDQHVLMVKDKTTAFEIFQTLCDKYEESAMKSSAQATNSVMSDEQKTLYLYHSLPDTWKPELAGGLERQSQVHSVRNRNGNRNSSSERFQGRNKFHGRRSNDETNNREYGIIAITTLDLTRVTPDVNLAAPVWTIDSGCTRHVTANPQWFEKLIPTAGKAITVGGNHQIPIKGTGDVKMKIKDTKGKEQSITLNNVLYAPGLEFNLLSVRQAVEDDFKINFPNAKKCVLFFAHRTKFEAKTGEGTRLYQFQASPPSNTQKLCDHLSRTCTTAMKTSERSHKTFSVLMLANFTDNRHDEEIRHLQSDNAREYKKLGKIIFQKYNTHAQFTTAYTPQQNGVAERRMRTLLERTRAFFMDGKLPHVLWGECVKVLIVTW